MPPVEEPHRRAKTRRKIPEHRPLWITRRVELPRGALALRTRVKSADPSSCTNGYLTRHPSAGACCVPRRRPRRRRRARCRGKLGQTTVPRSHAWLLAEAGRSRDWRKLEDIRPTRPSTRSDRQHPWRHYYRDPTPASRMDRILLAIGTVHCCSKVSRCSCITLQSAVSSGCRREHTGPEDAGCARAAASTKEDVGQRLTDVALLRIRTSWSFMGANATRAESLAFRARGARIFDRLCASVVRRPSCPARSAEI